jgi:putative DNA-binding protein
VEKGKTEFNPNVHITKPVVRLSPSRKYFTLSGVSYERVEAPAKKTAKPKPTPKPNQGSNEGNE